MTNELLPLKIQYSTEFKKELKRLGKKYRSIRTDVSNFIDSIKTDFFPGDVLQGIESDGTTYKARVTNSDNNKGKSGGYRIIYIYHEPDLIFLVTIYSKSEQPDVTAYEVNNILSYSQLEPENEEE